MSSWHARWHPKVREDRGRLLESLDPTRAQDGVRTSIDGVVNGETVPADVSMCESNCVSHTMT